MYQPSVTVVSAPRFAPASGMTRLVASRVAEDLFPFAGINGLGLHENGRLSLRHDDQLTGRRRPGQHLLAGG